MQSPINRPMLGPQHDPDGQNDQETGASTTRGVQITEHWDSSLTRNQEINRAGYLQHHLTNKKEQI